MMQRQFQIQPMDLSEAQNVQGIQMPSALQLPQLPPIPQIPAGLEFALLGSEMSTSGKKRPLPTPQSKYDGLNMKGLRAECMIRGLAHKGLVKVQLIQLLTMHDAMVDDIKKKYANMHDIKQLVMSIQQLDDKVDLAGKTEQQLQEIAADREIEKNIKEKVLDSQLGPKPKKPKPILFGLTDPSSAASLITAVHASARGGSSKSMHSKDESNGDDVNQGQQSMDVDEDSKQQQQQQHVHSMNESSGVDGVDYSQGAPIVIPIATQVFATGDINAAGSASQNDVAATAAALAAMQDAPFDLVTFLKSLDWQGQIDVRDETVKIVQENGISLKDLLGNTPDDVLHKELKEAGITKLGPRLRILDARQMLKEKFRQYQLVPTRKGKRLYRKVTLTDLGAAHERYDDVQRVVSSQSLALRAALRQLHVSKSTFQDSRYIAELFRLDRNKYEMLVADARNKNASPLDLNKNCHRAVQEIQKERGIDRKKLKLLPAD